MSCNLLGIYPKLTLHALAFLQLSHRAVHERKPDAEHFGQHLSNHLPCCPSTICSLVGSQLLSGCFELLFDSFLLDSALA